MFILKKATGKSDCRSVQYNKGGNAYVPQNFAPKRQSLEGEEWFVGCMPRSRAEKIVLSSNVPEGAYLVRVRETDESEYALTVRDTDDSDVPARNYRIRRTSTGDRYFITERRKFDSVQGLVSHYTKVTDGLCCRLSIPAPHVVPKPSKSDHYYQAWEIPRNQLQFERKLGAGSYGEVWFGVWRGMVDVAIKKMKPGTMTAEAFLGEAQIMKQCDHPNLVKLYAVCTKKEPFYIVTEYMCNGSLLHYLRHVDEVLTKQALVGMCAQIANGMKYLEERKLVHRDLAARNVLVGEVVSKIPVVKVADFGLARKLMEDDIYEARTDSEFPLKWTAPEAARCGNFTVKSDVWSYGILLYEIMTGGEAPYPGIPNSEVIDRIIDGYKLPKPRNCSERLYEVMRKCWSRNPERRPTFDYLFHFFDEYFVRPWSS